MAATQTRRKPSSETVQILGGTGYLTWPELMPGAPGVASGEGVPSLEEPSESPQQPAGAVA